MKRLAFLIGLALAATVALEAQCTGAETPLKEITRQLARNAVGTAEKLLAPLERAYTSCPRLLLPRARIEAATGADTAAELFANYLAHVPGDATGMAFFARFLIDQAKYPQADALSADALNLDPGNPTAMAVRGQILDMKRQPQSALALLVRSCELDPEDAEAQFQLGALYDRAKRPADAVRHFQRVVALDPGYASAWDYLALNLEPLGDLDAADTAYRKGLDANAGGVHHDSFLDYNYGRLLARRGQLTESKRHFDRAVEFVPDIRATWYDRAKLNLQMDNYPQARTDAEKALSLTGRTGGILDLQVYSLLEKIYRRLGESALAETFARLTRDTPPPTRKGYGEAAP